MSNLKIYITIPGSMETSGGIGRQMGYLMDALREHHPDLEIVTLDTRGSGSVLKSPYYLFKAIRQIQNNGDAHSILHVNLASYASTLRKYFLIRAAKNAGIPVIIHLHGGGFQTFYHRCPSWIQQRIRDMFEQATMVVVLGQVWRDFVTQTLGISTERVHIIYNAVPPPIPAPKSDLVRHNKDEVRLLFLGRLNNQKGVRDLLQALGSRQVQRLNWHLTLAGDGRKKPYLRMAEELNIDHYVDMPGWLDQAGVNRALRNSHVLVLPSYVENLPICILEAMAHGMPVITTTVGAIPEVIRQNVEGLLISPGDVEGLAGALMTVIEDKPLRMRLGTAAQDRYQELFSIHKCSADFYNLYRHIAINCA